MFGFPWGKKGYEYDNTRRYLRFPANWPVKCEVRPEQTAHRVTETVDVSAGGLALLVPDSIAVGSRIRVEVYVPPLERSLTAEAQVVRCTPLDQNGFEIGVRFVQIEPKDQQALNDAVGQFYNARQKNRQQTGRWWRRLPCLLGLILGVSSTAWGFDADPYKPITAPANELATPQITAADIFKKGEPESLFKFFAERTQIGLGYDLVYSDNILLEDNLKRDDYIQTVESVILFADPRGSILYGAQYEVNAFRYTKSDANAIDHDLVTFFDLDPGGRTKLRTTYTLEVKNGLTFGNFDEDLLRRGTDFQQTVEHEWNGRLHYALTLQNALTGGVSWTLFDDQTANDAGTDRKTLKGTLDFEHALTPTWTLFGGGLFEDIQVPGDVSKNDNAYGARLGVRHEVRLTERLDATLEIKRPQFEGQERDTDVNFSGFWEHLLNPRTKFKLGYSDTRKTSFVTGRTQFRSRSPSLVVTYDLTPRTVLNVSGRFEKQKATDELQKQYNLRAGLKWQVREQAHVTLEYSNTRSTTRDITSHIASLGVEVSF